MTHDAREQLAEQFAADIRTVIARLNVPLVMVVNTLIDVLAAEVEKNTSQHFWTFKGDVEGIAEKFSDAAWKYRAARQDDANK